MGVTILRIFDAPLNLCLEVLLNYRLIPNLLVETSERFSQLVTAINLIKVGPKRGLFHSCVNLTEKVSRLQRAWLAEEAANLKQKQGEGPSNTPGFSIIWTDASENFGLKVRVVKVLDELTPILVGPGEDPPVSYTLEYQGMQTLCNLQLLCRPIRANSTRIIYQNQPTCNRNGTVRSSTGQQFKQRSNYRFNVARGEAAVTIDSTVSWETG